MAYCRAPLIILQLLLTVPLVTTGCSLGGVSNVAQDSGLLTPPAALEFVDSNPTLDSASPGVPYKAVLLMRGGVQPYKFKLTNAMPAGLALSPSENATGLAAVISGEVPLSEINKKYTFQITATDAAGNAAQKTFALDVSPYNFYVTPTQIDAMPAATADEGGYKFTPTAVGAAQPVSWSATGLPMGLQLNTTTGELFTTNSLRIAAQEGGSTRTVILEATDANGVKKSVQYTLTVNVPKLFSDIAVVTTSPLRNARIGVEYETQILVKDGIPNATGVPYTIALAGCGGTNPCSLGLPPGLSYNALTSTISGTPTSNALVSPNSYTMVFVVDDAPNTPQTPTVVKPLAITVEPQIPQLYPAGAGSPLTASLPDTSPERYYAQQISVGGGVAPFSFTEVAPLNDCGLIVQTLDATNGLALIHTAHTVGASTVQDTLPSSKAGSSCTVYAKATDSKSTQSSTIKYVFNVQNYSVAVVNPGTISGSENVQLTTVQLSASGGTGPYSWRVNAATPLPAGLTLSADGKIQGTPGFNTGSSGGTNYVFNVRAVDAVGLSSAWLPISASIGLAPLSITTSSLPLATRAANYLNPDASSVTLSAQGGRAPYTFTVSNGILPTGLSLSAAGTLSGQPNINTTCPLSSFTVRVQDSTGANATQSLCIKVTDGLSINTSFLPSAAIGQQYSASIEVSGGSGVYSYSFTGVPVGLTIIGNTISNVPAIGTAGVHAVTAVVSDSDGRITSRTYELIISLTPLQITTTTLPKGGAGISYSTNITVVGGSGSYAEFAVASGALPNGLTLNPTTGIISGTIAYDAHTRNSGQYAFTVSAKDSNNASVTSGALNISVSVPPKIRTGTIPTAVVGTRVFYYLPLLGGVAPFTFSATPLPAGITLDATAGIISGVPLLAGNQTVNITVTDAKGLSTTRALNWKILASAKNFDMNAPKMANLCPPPRWSSFTGILSGGAVPWDYTENNGSYGWYANRTPGNRYCMPLAYSTFKVGASSFVVYSYSEGDTSVPGTWSGSQFVNSRLRIAKIMPDGRIGEITAATVGPNLQNANLPIPLPSPTNGFTGTGWISDLVTGDFNKDGNIDLAFVTHNRLSTTENNLIVMWGANGLDGNGFAQFSTSTSWDLTANSSNFYHGYRIKTADLRNQGTLDLIVLGNGNNTPNVEPAYRADHGQFMAKVMILSNSCTSTNCPTNESAFIPGTTAAGTLFMPMVPVNTTITTAANGLGTITPSGGYLDQFTWNANNNSVTIRSSATPALVGSNYTFVSNTASTFTIQTSVTSVGTHNIELMLTMRAALDFDIGKIDNDNCPDIVVAGRSGAPFPVWSKSWIFTALQNGACDGGFALNNYKARQLSADVRPYSVKTANLTGDSIDEILVTTSCLLNGGVTSTSVFCDLNPWSQASTYYAPLYILQPPTTGDINAAAMLSPRLPGPASQVTTYCPNGEATCSEPSLLIVGGRPPWALPTGSDNDWTRYYNNIRWGENFNNFPASLTYLKGPINSSAENPGSRTFPIPGGVFGVPQKIDLRGNGRMDLILLGTTGDGTRTPWAASFQSLGSDTAGLFRAASGLKVLSEGQLAATDATAVDTGDVNGDGFQDTVTFLPAKGMIAVHFGDGNGSFDGPYNYVLGSVHAPCSWCSGSIYPDQLHAPAAQVMSDFNNDGRDDIVNTAYSQSAFTVLLTDSAVPSGTAQRSDLLQPAIQYPTGRETSGMYAGQIIDARPLGMTSGDFDNDGIVDLASFAKVIDKPSKGLFRWYIYWYRGLGSGLFESPRLVADYSSPGLCGPLSNNNPTKFPVSIMAADLNLNRSQQLLIMCENSYVTAARLTSTTTLLWSFSNAVGDPAAPGGVKSFRFGYLDAGAACLSAPARCFDLVLATHDANRPVIVMRNISFNSIADILSSPQVNYVGAPDQLTVPTLGQVSDIILSDFNLDGKTDVAANMWSENWSYCSLNTIPLWATTACNSEYNSNGTNLRVYLNSGTGIDGNSASYSIGGNSLRNTGLAVGHFDSNLDSDNMPDIAQTSLGYRGLSRHVNMGTTSTAYDGFQLLFIFTNAAYVGAVPP